MITSSDNWEIYLWYLDNFRQILPKWNNLRSRKEGKEDYISNIAYMLLTDACKNTLCTLRIIMLSKTSRFVCPDLFFYKQNTKKLWKWAWNMFVLSIVLELKVENSTILTVNVKNQPNPSDLFSLKIIKREVQLLLIKYFDNFDF